MEMERSGRNGIGGTLTINQSSLLEFKTATVMWRKGKEKGKREKERGNRNDASELGILKLILLLTFVRMNGKGKGEGEGKGREGKLFRYFKPPHPIIQLSIFYLFIYLFMTLQLFLSLFLVTFDYSRLLRQL